MCANCLCDRRGVVIANARDPYRNVPQVRSAVRLGNRDAARMRSALRARNRGFADPSRRVVPGRPSRRHSTCTNPLRAGATAPAREASAVRMSGRWVRRGSTVILFGVDRDRGSGSDRAVVRELPLEVTGTNRTRVAEGRFRRGRCGSAGAPCRDRLLCRCGRRKLRIADRRCRQSLPAVARARR